MHRMSQALRRRPLAVSASTTAGGFAFFSGAAGTSVQNVPMLTDGQISASVSQSATKRTVRRGTISTCHTAMYQANQPSEDTISLKLTTSATQGGALFGVFDGHSGSSCSRFCRDHLFRYIEYYGTRSKGPLLRPEAFLAADDDFLDAGLAVDKPVSGPGLSGACAVVCHVKGHTITTANAGDCRAVVGRRVTKKSFLGSTYVEWQAHELTTDHELTHNQDERDRLSREHPDEPDVLGSRDDPRVKGMLQPSRGLGDGLFKRMAYFELVRNNLRNQQLKWSAPYTSAEPDITTHTITAEDKFLVMATDGLFQDLSSQEVVEELGRRWDEQQVIDSEAAAAAAAGQAQAAGGQGDETVAAADKDKGFAGGNPAVSMVKHALLAASRHMFGEYEDVRSQMSIILSVSPRQRRRVHDDISVLVVQLDTEADNHLDDGPVESGPPIAKPKNPTAGRIKASL